MQKFHMQTQKYGDIGYNFMIGCDGEVYEGRGFNVVGAHTLTYNRKSLGIAFIGDFRTKSVPLESLERCKALLQKGVTEGYIVPNYKIFGQCDVQDNASPGHMLHKELHRLQP